MSHDPEHEDRTVQRMLDGDEDAFRELYRAIQPGLLRYLTVLVGASESVQETVLPMKPLAPKETWAWNS